MTRLNFALTPADTFFFRDGKPFARGEQSEADGIFPPFPSTAYGALRTAYIAEHSMREFKEGILKKTIGTTDSESVKDASFRIKGIFLADNSNTYFPLPRDLVQGKDDKEIYPLILSEQSDMESNSKTQRCLICNENMNVKYQENTFLNEEAMREYLLDKSIPTCCKTEEHFLKKEPKIGIRRSAATFTAEDGLLYRLDMMRLQDGYRLSIETAGINFQNRRGILKLGGENKPFAYEISESTFSWDGNECTNVLKEKLEEKRCNGKIRFKLYFATPTIWKDGWLSLERFVHGNYHLIAASVGKHQNVGGWDLGNRKPKPKRMFRAVPHGSVYYLEAKSDNISAQDIINTFHCQNISDERSEEGFGLALIGIF